ncbi:hypothetical protein ONS95_008511 [Cadophora gregata]|uniref:uncharacterized protein n=1 Tax=Cadophora gregata TaxID=51156 RepID=UPI0026DAF4BC|nr:uncharacterized protein ONS95_008511 [Cadophora gregata]KAK0100173.1 hypothetical protein ONS95_008511 [Cadophora gregata]
MVKLSKMDLPQIASLSLNEAKSVNSKDEVEKPKVVLVNDIWYMVFAKLVKENLIVASHPSLGRLPHTKEFYDWLRGCRLVSKDFDMIVMPLGYSFVDMSGPLIKDRLPNVSGPLRDSFVELIKDVTTVLQLPHVHDLEFETDVSQLIESCQRLKKVQFKNMVDFRDNTGHNMSYLASIWLSSFLNNRRHPQGCCFSVDSRWTVIEQTATPYDNLALPYHPAAGRSIDRLGINFWCNPSPFRYLSPTGHRLPAMERLFLNNYDWKHSWKEFGLIWDFSELCMLTLEEMDLIQFFMQIPVDSWWQVCVLVIEAPKFDMTNYQSMEEMQEMARAVMRQIFNHFTNLRSLEIGCDELHKVFPIDVIAGTLENLESLELTGVYDEQPISLPSLKEILFVGKNIKSLVLEFSPVDGDAFEILKLLAQTPGLRHIDLIMSAHNLGVDKSKHNATDPDYDAAEKLLRYLHSHRLGDSLQFRLLVRHSSPPPAWKPADGEVWDSCRSYESKITEFGVYQQTGSQRIGPRTSESSLETVDGGASTNEVN